MSAGARSHILASFSSGMGAGLPSSELQLRRDLLMAAKGRQIDIGRTKKGPRPSPWPTLVFLLVAGGVGYYIWTEPIGLELKQAIQTVTGPVERIITDLLNVE